MKLSSIINQQSVALGEIVEFPNNFADRIETNGQVYLRSGSLETDPNFYDASLLNTQVLPLAFELIATPTSPNINSWRSFWTGACYIIVSTLGRVYTTTDFVTFTQVVVGGVDLQLSITTTNSEVDFWRLGNTDTVILRGTRNDTVSLYAWISFDLGLTWHILSDNITGESQTGRVLNDYFEKDGKYYLFFQGLGDQGFIFESIDTNTWNEYSRVNANTYGMKMLISDDNWCAITSISTGSYRDYYTSSDNGTTWTYQNTLVAAALPAGVISAEFNGSHVILTIDGSRNAYYTIEDFGRGALTTVSLPASATWRVRKSNTGEIILFSSSTSNSQYYFNPGDRAFNTIVGAFPSVYNSGSWVRSLGDFFYWPNNNNFAGYTIVRENQPQFFVNPIGAAITTLDLGPRSILSSTNPTNQIAVSIVGVGCPFISPNHYMRIK